MVYVRQCIRVYMYLDDLQLTATRLLEGGVCQRVASPLQDAYSSAS